MNKTLSPLPPVSKVTRRGNRYFVETTVLLSDCESYLRGECKLIGPKLVSPGYWNIPGFTIELSGSKERYCLFMQIKDLRDGEFVCLVRPQLAVS